MNEYISVLLKNDYEPMHIGGEIGQLTIWACRWWIDEEPGVFQMEPGGDDLISINIYPNGTMELLDGLECTPLIDQLIQIPSAKKLPEMITQLEKAFGNQTSLEEGTQIMKSLLS